MWHPDTPSVSTDPHQASDRALQPRLACQHRVHGASVAARQSVQEAGYRRVRMIPLRSPRCTDMSRICCRVGNQPTERQAPRAVMNWEFDPTRRWISAMRGSTSNDGTLFWVSGMTDVSWVITPPESETLSIEILESCSTSGGESRHTLQPEPVVHFLFSCSFYIDNTHLSTIRGRPNEDII